MKKKMRPLAPFALLALLLGLLGAPAAVATTPASVATAAKPTPVSGKQLKPSVAAGSKKAPKLAPLGKSQQLPLDRSGRPIPPTAGKVSAAAGYVAGVDFAAATNYCQQGWTYTPVKNTTAATKYVKIDFYNGSVTQTYYTSVSANSTAYPYFLGVSGSWYAYLYVWDGTQYAYDEYKSGSNNCSLSVSINKYPGYTGYVLFTIKNNGNAYASVNTNELAPYPAAGTYTGSQWDYPAPGGGTVYRYMYVGTGLKYGIFTDLYGALYYSPWAWTGTL